MMRETTKTIIFLLMLLGVTPCFGSQPVLLWSTTFGSSGDDEANAVAMDVAGNAIVTGYSWKSTNKDFRTIKYDAAGQLIWTATYNGVLDNTDIASAVGLDEYGAVFVVGYIYAVGGDYLLAKYTSSGLVDWQVIGMGFSGASGIAVDTSGSIYVTGWGPASVKDFRTIKYSRSGAALWEYSFDSGGDDDAHGVAVDSSGAVIVTGTSQGNFRTIKYNAAGGIDWNVVYDSGGADESRGLALDASGNVHVAGWSTAATSDFRVIKYDAYGNVVWSRSFDGGFSDQAFSIAVDAGGNAYAAGSSGNGANLDARVLKYDALGNLIWSTTLNGGGDDEVHGVAVGASGNIVIAGMTTGAGKDILVAQYRQDSASAPATTGESPVAGPSLGTADGSVKIVGGIRGYLDPKRGEVANILVRAGVSGVIVVRIFDLRGVRVRELQQESHGAGVQSIHWNGADDNGQTVAPGIYTVIVTGEGLKYSGKIAVVR